MCHTHHAKNYTNTQASEKIRQYLIELCEEFGINASEVVSSRDCDLLIKKLEQVKNKLEKAYRRGGVTVVNTDNRLLTAYRFAGFNPNYIDPKNAAKNLTPAERAFLETYRYANA